MALSLTYVCESKFPGGYNVPKLDADGKQVFDVKTDAAGNPQPFPVTELKQSFEVTLMPVGGDAGWAPGRVPPKNVHAALMMHCLSPEAAAMFTVGQQYTLSFAPATTPVIPPPASAQQ